MNTAVGYDLKLRLKVELGGEEPPPQEVVDKVNLILKEVDDGLTL